MSTPVGDHASPPLRQAVAWNAALNVGRRVTTTAVTFVLAGLLGPADFGTVALASIYVLLLQLFFQQGFAPALIARPRLNEEAMDAAFRVLMVGSVGMVALSLALSQPVGALLQDDDLAPAICLLSLQLPILALGLVQESILRRASDFRRLAFRTNTAVVVGGICGVLLAFAGAGILALIAQQLVTAAVSTTLVWGQVRWRPSLRRRAADRAVAREIVGTSSRVSIAATAQFAALQLDSVLVGLIFGTTAVGLYRVAGRAVETALDVGARTLQGAFLPDLARLQGDADALLRRLIEQQRLACSLTMPLFGTLAGCATPLVALLGPSWSAAAAPLTGLAAGALGTVLVTTATPALQARGRAEALAKMNLASVAILFAALAVTGLELTLNPVSDEAGLVVVAVVRGVFASTLAVLIALAVLHRVMGVSRRSMLRASAPGLLGAAAGLAIGTVATTSTSEWADVPRALVVVALSGAASMVVTATTDTHLRSLAVRRFRTVRPR